jgi:proteasome lid subunit RPN8/RPN11
LRLGAEALSAVVGWQRKAGSKEVCGLCAVDQSGEQRMLLLANHAGLANEFEVSRSEEEVARAAARERGWEIVAFVHTHPDHAPKMSAHDTRCFERDTFPWIIVGTPLSGPSQCVYSRAAGDRMVETSTG